MIVLRDHACVKICDPICWRLEVLLFCGTLSLVGTQVAIVLQSHNNQ